MSCPRPGVKAVRTGHDIAETSAKLAMGEGAFDLHDVGDNLLAHGKVLYHGHPVAAVAATSLDIAREAAAQIKVEYEPLQPVLTIDQALSPDAPILHDDLVTQGRGVTGTGPTT